MQNVQHHARAAVLNHAIDCLRLHRPFLTLDQALDAVQWMNLHMPEIISDQATIASQGFSLWDSLITNDVLSPAR